MGWETRANNRYYYRKRRVNGRVRSEYVGSGIFAELAAQMDEMDREDRERIRAEQMRARDEFMELSHQVDAINERLRSLTSAALMGAGWYMHRGQWRRKRE